MVALPIVGIHSFGDTLLPRVHTTSQQAHGKLKIDSARFYTHKFLHPRQPVLFPFVMNTFINACIPKYIPYEFTSVNHSTWFVNAAETKKSML